MEESHYIASKLHSTFLSLTRAVAGLVSSQLDTSSILIAPNLQLRAGKKPIYTMLIFNAYKILTAILHSEY